MTTIVSPDGSAEIINVRRTESLDARNILNLVSPYTKAIFGRVDVVNLIEKAVFAVTLVNDKDEVMGHASFFDYPNFRGVEQSAWESWISEHYDSKDYTPLNTLFLQYFVAKADYSQACAREIIRTAFNAIPDVHFIFLIVPMEMELEFPEPALSNLFSPLDRQSTGLCDFSIFGCNRSDHVPVLHIRPATVEDHDDLTPIFNRQSNMLKHTYGDFFLAELIEAQDEHMKCLVAEVNGDAIGFMSICDDVNSALLNEAFELGPFHGLQKPHTDDELLRPKTPTPPPSTDVIRTTTENPMSAAVSVRLDESKQDTRDTSKKDGSEKLTPLTTEMLDQDSGSTLNPERDDMKSVTSPSKKESPAEERIKIQSKLSTSHMVDDGSSILSDRSDTNSEKSYRSKGADSLNSSAVAGEGALYQMPETIVEIKKSFSPHAKIPNRFVPVYHGELDAFSIQLFCIDERYEMRACDFLPKAFSLFPDCDMCAVTVPHLVPEFPLLKSFVRVSPRCPSTLSQELYVFHRAGLKKDIHVRAASNSDYGSIVNLMTTIDFSENLLTDLQQFNMAKRDSDGTRIQAFIAECQQQIIGIAIIRCEENIEYIRSHYSIEDFIYFNHHKRDEHAHLHHFVINPIFAYLSKHFLKEILRLGHKTCLYYPLYPPHITEESLQNHSLVTVLNELVPVRARRQIIYPIDKLGINAPSERVLKKMQSYALNHINRKLTLEPKVTINIRIVVVGASDIGMAFLETLAYCPHLRFNNLTLVSPHGLPCELKPDELRDQMLMSSNCYSQEEYDNIGLRTWVNVVYGKMTKINRSKKLVVVNGNASIPYDHLVLCTGQQYQVPAPTVIDIDKLAAGVSELDITSALKQRYEGVPPKNIFLINDSYDSAMVLYWVENHLIKTNSKVLLYGHTLDVYCCLQGLLSLGLPGNQIILVEPPLDQDTLTCFNNPDVERCVYASLKDAGVVVHSDYILINWDDKNTGEEITSASFVTTKGSVINLDFIAFIAYSTKDVDMTTFKAVNDACLVYDGKLVIDAIFHTNDISIRAAGPLTKFQRKYHADQWTHDNFNSKEVGMALASTMLRLFDPTQEIEKEPPKELLNLIPIYRNAKIQGGVVPGGYSYLKIAKPGLAVLLKNHMSQVDSGDELITGNSGDVMNYFRLHINQYSCVETITCLTKSPLPASNLICLYGVHERFLNNLLSRFKEELITNFYSFFHETWALAIYHDRWSDFREEIRELLMTRPTPGVQSLEERVRDVVDEDVSLNAQQYNAVHGYYSDSGAKRMVETRLLSFLGYNQYHLPSYAQPGMV